jgi:sigma-B regulation protein RsbU (phosphoserine phosphatase)
VVLEINGAPFSLTAVERYVILAMRDITRRKQMEESLRASRQRMADELKVAHDIQMSLLPRRYPKRPEIDVYAAIQPAREVGGDFYDFYFINPSQFAIAVGDVSGKGVPAALFMAMTKTLVRNRVQGQTRTADVVQRANRVMCEDNPSHMFVSLFLAVLDIHTGRLTYTNAGHNPPLLKRSDGRLHRLDLRNGPVMGASKTCRYTEGRLSLQAGDTLLVYTDGVTEAADGKQVLFSEKRLMRLLSEAGDQSPEAMVQAVLEAVNVFQEEEAPADDMTLLALRFRGNPFSYDI